MNLDEHPHRGIDREQEGPHAEEGAYGEPRESKHVQHGYLLRSAIALVYEPITNLAHLPISSRRLSKRSDRAYAWTVASPRTCASAASTMSWAVLVSSDD